MILLLQSAVGDGHQCCGVYSEIVRCVHGVHGAHESEDYCLRHLALGNGFVPVLQKLNLENEVRENLRMLAVLL